MDSVGSLYVADSLNHTVRKVTTSGTVITFAGAAGVRGTADGTLTGGVSSARLAYPNSVAVDSTSSPVAGRSVTSKQLSGRCGAVVMTSLRAASLVHAVTVRARSISRE